MARAQTGAQGWHEEKPWHYNADNPKHQAIAKRWGE
jgi:hypothetical protein